MLLELCYGENDWESPVQSHKWVYNSETLFLPASYAEASLDILVQIILAFYHPKTAIDAFGAAQGDILFLFQPINKGVGSIN